MAERTKAVAKGKSDWPLWAGIGLIGGGLALWWLSSSAGASAETDDPLIQAEKEKFEAMMLYHEQIYGADGLRQPTEAEITSLGMMSEAMSSEESRWHYRDKAAYIRSIDDFLQTLGLFVILPSIAGFIILAGMKAYDRWRRPPQNRPPTACPKCGILFSDPDQAAAHASVAHPATTDAASIAEAAKEWQGQPFWSMAEVAITAGTYSSIYNPLSNWSYDTLNRNLQGMLYSLVMATGSTSSMAAMSRTIWLLAAI